MISPRAFVGGSFASAMASSQSDEGWVHRELSESIDPDGNTSILLVTTDTQKDKYPSVQLIRGRFYVRDPAEHSWSMRRFALYAQPNANPAIAIYKDNDPKTEIGENRILGILITMDVYLFGE
jgi:hypothetical protein